MAMWEIVGISNFVVLEKLVIGWMGEGRWRRMMRGGRCMLLGFLARMNGVDLMFGLY